MIDIVVNHFGWPGSSTSVDYTQFYPFNNKSYFHSYCDITNWNNQTQVEDCWIGDNTVALADVATDQPYVQSTYQSWISNLVKTYNIDGLRIDTVKHVQKSFWPPFNQAAGVYCLGEVAHGDPTYTCPYQLELDGVLNYPMYWPLLRAFSSTSGSISDLVSMINTVKSDCADPTLLGLFSENHDQPRFASFTSDMSLASNIIAFTIMHDGIPIIYAGQEQHYNGVNDPYNREATWLSAYPTSAPLYRLIASLNQVRNRALYMSANYLTYMSYPIYSDASTIALRKGYSGNQVVTVLSNLGASGTSYTLTVGNTGYTAGQVVMEMLSCKTATANADGSIPVTMGGGQPKVFYPVTQIKGSGMCGQ
jgi:alpha-amylase